MYMHGLHRLLVIVVLIGVTVGCTSDVMEKSAADKNNTAYLFTYFTKNGEDGLHLAASVDGYQWKKIPRADNHWRPAIGSSKLMRDPSVVRGPDGTYHYSN